MNLDGLRTLQSGFSQQIKATKSMQVEDRRCITDYDLRHFGDLCQAVLSSLQFRFKMADSP